MIPDIERGNRCGYAIGVSYPPDWGEHTASLRPGDRTVLAPNMTFHMILGMWMDDYGFDHFEAFVEARKRDLLRGLEGTLVEIGAGTGPNLRHLPAGLHVVGVEPNPFMHSHFLSEAGRQGRSVSLIRGRADRQDSRRKMPIWQLLFS